MDTSKLEKQVVKLTLDYLRGRKGRKITDDLLEELYEELSEFLANSDIGEEERDEDGDIEDDEP